jgi:hypothetical protein
VPEFSRRYPSAALCTEDGLFCSNGSSPKGFAYDAVANDADGSGAAFATPASPGADTFDPISGQVTVASLIFEQTEYSNIVLVPGEVVRFSTTPTAVTDDEFDSASGQLTMRTVTVGSQSYYNVVITVADVLSIGSSGPVQNTALTACPSATINAAGTKCFLVSPDATGATGVNATIPSVAMCPDTSEVPPRRLVYMNGSGGSPLEAVASPDKSVYSAATSERYAVFGVSYSSNQAIGSLCKGQDSCYFPSRATVITGKFATGASPSLSNLTPDQGIVGRLVLGLQYLEKHDPGHGWGSFLAEGSGVDATPAWSKITVIGSSQGGGHAAAMGKLYPAARVIQLSATCDVNGTNNSVASWLDGSVGSWASDPRQFYGLGSYSTVIGTTPISGDTTCPTHALAWNKLGMIGVHQHDDATTCGKTGDLHSASTKCSDNYARWQEMLQ